MKGVGRYTWQIWDALRASQPLEARLVAVIFENSVEDELLPGSTAVLRIPYASELNLGMKVMPRLLREVGADTFIRPADKIGRRYAARTLTVCHDLNHWIWRVQAKRGLRRRCIDAAWEALRVRGLRCSDLVVCNSEFVRQGVISEFGIDRERTAIGYCGVDARFTSLAPRDAQSELPAPLNASPFVLAFATGDPREGYDILPELFRAAKQGGYPGQLALAGTRDGAEKRDLAASFARCGVLADVQWLPFLGADQFGLLVALYRHADFYLETSRHEGFGMQLVEAMACGTTCFSSGRGALAEVGGAYPLPLDIDRPSRAGQAVAEAWSAGAAVRDNEPQIRHARSFDWQATRKLVAEFAWGPANSR